MRNAGASSGPSQAGVASICPPPSLDRDGVPAGQSLGEGRDVVRVGVTPPAWAAL